MIKQKTVTIAGDEFLLTQFPATVGIRYQKKIAKVLLPSMAEILKNQENPEVNGAALAMEKLAENIDLIDEELIKEMILRGATKGTATINFDMEFAGEYNKLFDLLKEIIMFNFAGVFTAFASGSM